MTRYKARTIAILTLLLCLTISHAALAMDFRRSTLEGEVVTLSQFRGRVVVLDFFATYCGPCTQAMPKLKSLQRTYGHAGLSVLGYSVDREGATVVGPYAARLGLNFPIVLGNAKEAKRIAGVEALPTTLIIDPKGRVVARFKGSVSKKRLLAAVRPYLRAGAKPAPVSASNAYDQPSSSRFSRVWVTPNMLFQGKEGVFVHAMVNVADLNPYQGLWLGLDMTPKRLNTDGSTVRMGRKIQRFQRIDDAWRSHFILFLSCDQLPALGRGGALHSQMTLLGPGQKVLARSDDFWMADECSAGAAANKKEFEQADPWLRGEKTKRPTGMLDEYRWNGNGRLTSVWLTGPTTHEDQPGYMVHINADLGGLSLDDGVWFCLNFGPPRGAKSPAGYSSSRLLHRVDSKFPSHYILFVSCDQLPVQAAKGGAGMWVSLLAGYKRSSLERSGVFNLTSPCRATAKQRQRPDGFEVRQ